MNKFWFRILMIPFVGSLTLTAPKSVQAKVLSRPALLSLAHDFVTRIEQKMPGTVIEDPLRHVPEGEVLMLQPRLKGNVLIEGQIDALRRGHNIYLALNSVFNALGFPLQVHAEEGTARGWYIRETFDFDMDLQKGIVVSRGSQFPVTAEEWFVQDGEVYVLSTSINKWMKIDSDFMWDSLLVDFAADVPFPLEIRLKRRTNSTPYDKKDNSPKLPRLEQPYELADVPRANILVTNGIMKSPGEATNVSRTMRIDTAGDLFGMTTRTFTTLKNEHGINDFRFTVERESENADMLGPLKASRIEAGDLSPRGIDMAGYVSPGLGVHVTNNKDAIIAGQTSRTFEGDVAPDWDVELYEGNNLIGFQTVGSDSRYQFENVDLYAGNNDFRLVFYGPQGEIREEHVNIPIDIADVGADQHLYDISATLGKTQTYQHESSNDPDKAAPQIVVTYSRGIRDGLSINAGVETVQANDEQKVFANAGVATRLGNSLLNFDVVTDNTLEGAFRSIVRRSFGEHDFFTSAILRTPNYNPENKEEDALDERFENKIAVRGPIATLFGQRLSYNFDTTYSGDYNDQDHVNSRLALNTRIGRYSIGEAFQYLRSTDRDGSNEEYIGTTSVRTNLIGTRLRGDIQYALSPNVSWKQILLDAERDITQDASLRAEITSDRDPNKTELALSSNWHTPKFTVTPRVSYDTDKDLRATISVSTGLLYDKKENSVYLTNGMNNDSGSVRAFVYLDKDGNRIFDSQDEPLPGVRVMSVQVSRSAKTDDNGVAMITDLPTYRLTDVVVDPVTLGDPYYVVGYDGASIYARPGKVAQLEFPVHLSGEVDGTITTAGNAQLMKSGQNAGGLHVDLINAAGNTIISSESAFDGYYMLSNVPPGRYLAMIRSDDLTDTGLHQPTPHIIDIGYDGKGLQDQNIRLEHGIEVPLAIRTLAKDEKNDLDLRMAESITVTFGNAYRSTLMAQLIRWRVMHILRRHSDTQSSIEVVDQRLVKNGKKSGYQLEATLPATALVQAQNICQQVMERQIPCALNVSPQALFDMATKAGNRQLAENQAH